MLNLLGESKTHIKFLISRCTLKSIGSVTETAIHALMNPTEITKWHPCLEDLLCPAEEALPCRTAIAKSTGSLRLREGHKFKVNLGSGDRKKQSYTALYCMLQALLVTISHKQSSSLPCSPHQKPTPGQVRPAPKIEGEIKTELEGLYL